MATPWSYFDKFRKYEDMYLPAEGEGDTRASQAVTAVCRLIHHWYNDGDVYDNRYALAGWENDLSSYANWLYKYFTPAPLAIREILDQIRTVSSEAEYEDTILRPLADLVFNPKALSMLDEYPAISESIYDCTGFFECE